MGLIQMAKKLRDGLRQSTMFGIPEEPEPSPPAVMPLEFDGKPVRVVNVGGDPWWVASDVCRVLGIGNASMAVNGNAKTGNLGLDDDEKGVINHDTPSGPQEMLCVNESGLYSLIFKSRKPDAKRFRKWVTSEVLPAIRKTGRYVAPAPQDPWSEARQKNREQNKKDNERIFREGGGSYHVAAHYNAIYRGLTGYPAKVLRRALGLKENATPLDSFALIPLTADTLTKAMAERIREDAEKSGKPIPLKELPKINEAKAREVRDRVLESLGGDYEFNVVDVTGKPVLDVERKSLGNPNRLALGG